MTSLIAIFRRELQAYFATPLATVFTVVFLFVNGIFTFYVGQFFARGQADLVSFFTFHPWLYLFFVPAVAMRLWAEERKSGTIELLLTLPVGIGAAVVAKFLAAWVFIGLALAGTVPLWITVNVLGSPDNGVILASYLGSFLMAGAYLAIGGCLSAITANQVIAFVVAVLVCFLFTVSGSPMVMAFFTGWAPQVLLDVIASFSFLTHFGGIINGVIDARDLIYFLSVMAVWLFATAVVVDSKKAS